MSEMKFMKGLLLHVLQSCAALLLSDCSPETLRSMPTAETSPAPKLQTRSFAPTTFVCGWLLSPPLLAVGCSVQVASCRPSLPSSDSHTYVPPGKGGKPALGVSTVPDGRDQLSMWCSQLDSVQTSSPASRPKPNKTAVPPCSPFTIASALFPQRATPSSPSPTHVMLETLVT
eukprot:RCo006873